MPGNEVKSDKERALKGITSKHKVCKTPCHIIGIRGKAIWWCPKCQQELKLKDVVWEQ